MSTIENLIEQKQAQIAQLEEDIAALERAQALLNASTSKRGRKKGTGRRGRPPGKASTEKSGKKSAKGSAKCRKQSVNGRRKSRETASEKTSSQ